MAWWSWRAASPAVSTFWRRLQSRRERAEPFPVPLLLIYAEQDPLVPPETGPRLQALLPEVRLVRLAQASHFAHVDAVERFLPPALEFLQDAGARSA